MKICQTFSGILLLATALTFTACSTGSNSNGDTALLPSTIVFQDGAEVSLKLNHGPYTNAVTGDGTGAITYTSGTLATATVNATTGVVSLVGVGTTVITAVKAETATHEAVSESYTLTVTDGIYSIGETGPSGVGLVFYITDGGLHGLEVASTDQRGPGIWGGWGTESGTGTALGTGSANTTAIIATNSTSTTAASICRNYRAAIEGDWYLPSRDELNAVWVNLVKSAGGTNNGVGGFSAGGFYWTSSEDTADPTNNAQSQYFADGTMRTYNNKFDAGGYIRAIRAF